MIVIRKINGNGYDIETPSIQFNNIALAYNFLNNEEHIYNQGKGSNIYVNNELLTTNFELLEQ